MNEARSSESCRIVSVSPVAAEHDLLVRDEAGSRTACTCTPSTSAPRAPSRSCVVASGLGGRAPASRAGSAISCAVRVAVPEGASALFGWCSSMISTESKNRARLRRSASRARRRCRSWAPPSRRARACGSSQLADLSSLLVRRCRVVPTTRGCSGRCRTQVVHDDVGVGEVDRDLGAASASANSQSPSSTIGAPGRGRRRPRPPADLGAHPAAGPEHARPGGSTGSVIRLPSRSSSGRSSASSVGPDHGRGHRRGEAASRGQRGDVVAGHRVDAARASSVDVERAARPCTSSLLPIRLIREAVSSRPRTCPPRSWPLAAGELGRRSARRAATSASSVRSSPATSPSRVRLAAGVAPRARRGRSSRSRRVHRVGQPALLADLLEQPRAHAAAERRDSTPSAYRRGSCRRSRRHAEHEVRLLGVVARRTGAGRPAARGRRPPCGRAGRRRRRRAGRRTPRRTSATTAAWSTLPATATTIVAGRVAPAVVAARPAPRLIAVIDSSEPDHRAAERVSPNRRSAKSSASRSSGSSSRIGDLFEAPRRARRRRPRRPSSRRARRRTTTSTASGMSRVEHVRVEAGVLLGGERVELAADRVDLLGDLAARSGARVPLNSRCSRKCDAPREPSGVSSREPTSTQTPTEARRTPGIVSVTTRRPPGSTVRATPDDRGDRAVARSRERRRAGRGAAADGAGDGTAVAARPGRTASSAPVPLGGVVGGRRRLAASSSLTGDQADLAAVVDLGDLDLELVADVDDVLDLADPLAAAQLGDVHQAVAAGQQRDERAERGGLDDGAQEALADLRHLRVGDRVDHVDRGLRRSAPSAAPT